MFADFSKCIASKDFTAATQVIRDGIIEGRRIVQDAKQRKNTWFFASNITGIFEKAIEELHSELETFDNKLESFKGECDQHTAAYWDGFLQ